jgi:F-type H+-transporting ATPase subunit beta
MNKDSLLTVDRSKVMTGKIYELQERLENAGVDNVTRFLVDLKGEVVDEDLPYGPLETLWYFDADLAARHKFPAINPLISASSVLEGAHTNSVGSYCL